MHLLRNRWQNCNGDGPDNRVLINPKLMFCCQSSLWLPNAINVCLCCNYDWMSDCSSVTQTSVSFAWYIWCFYNIESLQQYRVFYPWPNCTRPAEIIILDLLTRPGDATDLHESPVYAPEDRAAVWQKLNDTCRLNIIHSWVLSFLMVFLRACRLLQNHTRITSRS